LFHEEADCFVWRWILVQPPIHSSLTRLALKLLNQVSENVEQRVLPGRSVAAHQTFNCGQSTFVVGFRSDHQVGHGNQTGTGYSDRISVGRHHYFHLSLSYSACVNHVGTGTFEMLVTKLFGLSSDECPQTSRDARDDAYRRINHCRFRYVATKVTSRTTHVTCRQAETESAETKRPNSRFEKQ
jgi:hypothetical protein